MPMLSKKIAEALGIPGKTGDELTFEGLSLSVKKLTK
jgi:hypothetical protein